MALLNSIRIFDNDSIFVLLLCFLQLLSIQAYQESALKASNIFYLILKNTDDDPHSFFLTRIDIPTFVFIDSI
jgi:hypothetical protein